MCRRFCIFAVALITLAVTALPCSASDEAAKPAVQQKFQQPATQLVSTVTQAAVKAGVLSCASRINQVSNFLTTGTQGSGAFIFAPIDNPDQKMVSISMEIPQNSNLSAYGSASFAPNQANGCAAMYETIFYWPHTCDEVASKNYSNLKKTGVLSKNVAVFDAGLSTKIFLMPAGSGCVSIKKEVVQ